MGRRYKPPHSGDFRWVDLAPQLDGARDKVVTQVLQLRRSPHHAHIEMPGGLQVSICWSGIPRKPYHLWVKRAQWEGASLAPELRHVEWQGDHEQIGADIEKHRLPEILAQLAGITPNEAEEATKRLHNMLGPPVQPHLF